MDALKEILADLGFVREPKRRVIPRDNLEIARQRAMYWDFRELDADPFYRGLQNPRIDPLGE